MKPSDLLTAKKVNVRTLRQTVFGIVKAGKTCVVTLHGKDKMVLVSYDKLVDILMRLIPPQVEYSNSIKITATKDLPITEKIAKPKPAREFPDHYYDKDGRLDPPVKTGHVW